MWDKVQSNSINDKAMKKLISTALALAVGITANAQFTVTLNNEATTNINGNVFFSQEEGTTNWSIGEEYNPDLDLSQIKSISLAPKNQGPAVGDYYYSDGTWGTELDAAKKAIGVVFYVGNPSTDDSALQSEKPTCIHGLVVGLYQTQCEWQEQYGDFDSEYDMTVGEWIEENTDYQSITTRSAAMDSPINKILGYNNTMGIDAFNDEFSWDYPVIVGEKLSTVMSKTVAPEGTSGWYVPSVKEVSLLVSGAIEGNIDDLGYEDEPDNKNYTLISQKLSTIAGATPLGNSSALWSSTEYNVSTVYTIQPKNGLVMTTSKGGSNILRPILAF